MAIYFLALTSKCQTAATKSLNTFEGIQTRAYWILTTDLNIQPNPRLGGCFQSYNMLVLFAVWLHRILKTRNFH